MSSILIGGIGRYMTDSWRGAPRKPKIPPRVFSAPLPGGWCQALEKMILSPSGWRKVFSESENSDSTTLSVHDLQMTAGAGWLFAQTLKEHTVGKLGEIAVSTDSRPTSPLLAEAMIRGITAAGVLVRFLGVLPIPQLTAHVQLQESVSGFAYITASHNPKGHNGFKFGFGDGKVLHPQYALTLIEQFRALSKNIKLQNQILAQLERQNLDHIVRIYKEIPFFRNQSMDDYEKIFHSIVDGVKTSEQIETPFKLLKTELKAAGIGIVCDMNGSARSVSIDKEILTQLGIKTYFFNDKPGAFVHEILPEGEALNDCARELSSRVSKGFLLGYVPDCDGDRGNIVTADGLNGTVRTLESQEIFSLCVLSELCGLVYSGQLTYDEEGFPDQRVAVVVNDPTSLRIDRLAEIFRVPVFRAEVGEANVISLADQLREEGWYIRILGEGSNGGNITYPGTVRDPLSTLASLLKLLYQPQLFKIYCERAGLMTVFPSPITLSLILSSLPAFTTTPVGSPRALLNIPPLPQSRVKALFETLFITHGWNDQKAFLAQELGVYAWEEINYEGPEEKRGYGPPFRSGKESGGLKISLKDKAGKSVGFLWMRGSGTEPVFRIMADIQGNTPFHEEFLMNWLTGMLKKIF